MKQKIAITILAISLLAACVTKSKTGATQTSSKTGSGKTVMYNDETFQLTEVSADSTYGYTPENAIKVGGKKGLSGPASERCFLNALIGPEKETVVYNRKGSCCGVKSDNAPMGVALLDIYEVKYDGLEKPVRLYLNMYDPGEMKAPVGFLFRK